MLTNNTGVRSFEAPASDGVIEDPHTAELKRPNGVAVVTPIGAEAADAAAAHSAAASSSENDDDITAPIAGKAVRQPRLRAVESTVELAPGTTLGGRYVLESVIGRGGDSIVFRAKDATRYDVAIKVLLGEQRGNPRALARLKREFANMSALDHSGIARVFEIDHDGEIWFMSMELVNGQTANAWLQDIHSLWDRVRLISACARALEHAHAKGILHGDLKLSNVLVTPDGGVKLIDFGAIPDSNGDAESGSSVAVTASYASPQMLEGNVAEVRDDIFSLACVSYAILSKGIRAFGGVSSLDARAAGMVPAPLSGIPSHLAHVVLRGLAFEREQRPASVHEFLRGLLEREVTGRCNDTPPPNIPAQAAPDIQARKAEPPAHAPMIVVTSEPAVVPQTPSVATRRRLHQWVAGGVIAVSLLVAPLIAWLVQLGDTATQTQPQPALVTLAAPESPALPPAEPPPSILTRIEAQPPATKALPPRASGAITFDSRSMRIHAAQTLVAIPIRRLHSTRGTGRVAWTIEPASAKPGVDYQPAATQVVRFIEGQELRSLFVPLLKRSQTTAPRAPRTFFVTLEEVAGGLALGPIARITITIDPP